MGHGVSELSAAFALALEMGARLEDIAATIHVHPTLSECLREAALAALGHGLHALSDRPARCRIGAGSSLRTAGALRLWVSVVAHSMKKGEASGKAGKAAKLAWWDLCALCGLSGTLGHAKSIGLTSQRRAVPAGCGYLLSLAANRRLPRRSRTI